MADLFPFVIEGARAMVFVDGENLAIRYGSALAELQAKGGTSTKTVSYRPNVAVWASPLSPNPNTISGTRVMRKYYYTSVQGDDVLLRDTADWIKALGIESPRVFKKDKTKGSKQVDITLATDMLVHAARRHYDIAVLVAGDEDYVPLVRAVKWEGARVHVWFLSDGLSRQLRHEADCFVDLDDYLL
jgi:uncharacterized LabA/DUF88 family protein